VRVADQWAVIPAPGSRRWRGPHPAVPDQPGTDHSRVPGLVAMPHLKLVWDVDG